MLQRFPNSSWGRPKHEIDARVLRIYRSFLLRLSQAGEALNYILLTVMIAATVKLLVFTDFENLLPYDGTVLTCVLDGSTQGMPNVP
ncbi:hypothetical protein [Castellaniella sp.]|uniref:hypothetical protein n=1 Tax=Castellaniella sp. TaxID=1955812 RepID=UPI002AFE4E65|nr:hypothetical protein [Castellaniella sp.]